MNPISQLINALHHSKLQLEEHLKAEKQKRQFLSTTLFDAKYTIKQQKHLISKLERKIDRMRARKKAKLKNLFKWN